MPIHHAVLRNMTVLESCDGRARARPSPAADSAEATPPGWAGRPARLREGAGTACPPARPSRSKLSRRKDGGRSVLLYWSATLSLVAVRLSAPASIIAVSDRRRRSAGWRPWVDQTSRGLISAARSRLHEQIAAFASQNGCWSSTFQLNSKHWLLILWFKKLSIYLRIRNMSVWYIICQICIYQSRTLIESILCGLS